MRTGDAEPAISPTSINARAAVPTRAAAHAGFAGSFFHAGAQALSVRHWSVCTETYDLGILLRAEPGLRGAGALQRAMLACHNDTSSPQDAHPARRVPFAPIG